jgi:hypothetical protein
LNNKPPDPGWTLSFAPQRLGWLVKLTFGMALLSLPAVKATTLMEWGHDDPDGCDTILTDMDSMTESTESSLRVLIAGKTWSLS